MNRRSTCQRSIARPRRGYTLIEALLALSLSAILLAATFDALHQYYVLESHAAGRIKDAQIALGLMRDFEGDVLRVTSWENEAVSTERDLSGIIPTELLDRAQQLRFRELLLQIESQNETPITLHGTNRTLVLTVAGVNARFAESDALGTQDGSLRQIVWGLGDGRPLQATLVQLREQPRTLTLGGASGQRGLLRIVVPFAGQAQVDQASVVTVLREADRLQFRYSDGRGWYDEWSTTSRKSLPQAIEVKVAMAGAADELRWVVALAATGTPTEGRAR
jgi:prepilin-type N-terminal cleavage/methylation domain-containing protein